MKTILRVDASSVSCALGDYFERAWLDRNPSDRVIRRDVVTEPIGHIAEQTIAGFYTRADQLTDELRAATALSDRLIAELQSADVLLLTTPMYNFSVPSALKAWIDQIVRLGHTFAYDGSSFSGLATSREAYVVCAFGVGGYGDAERNAEANFLTPYLRFVLQFLGVQDVHVVVVEDTMGDRCALTASIEGAKREIDASIVAASTVYDAAA
ncbi:MAG TPA: NAD(P)H-dependent oxidoreductase [Thermomicrobiales bacterium]|nr:NAD(P)H-dependent oxidoreductase [Thermomicrobiales bacterium]